MQGSVSSLRSHLPQAFVATEVVAALEHPAVELEYVVVFVPLVFLSTLRPEQEVVAVLYPVGQLVVLDSVK